MIARFFKTRTGTDVADTPEVLRFEAAARNAHAVQLVDKALTAQADLFPDDRDLELVELCLDLRSALAPTPVDAYTIHELPSLRLRSAVPVIPGRSS